MPPPTLDADNPDNADTKSGESSVDSESESITKLAGAPPSAREQTKVSPPAANKTSKCNIIDIPPGALGIAVSVVEDFGALIEKILPSCPFKDEVQIGDVIASVDGKELRVADDLRLGNDRVRKFGIIPKAAVDQSCAPISGTSAKKKPENDNDSFNCNVFDIPPGPLGIAVRYVEDVGALIEKISPSCAFKDKVQIGDVIATVNGKKVASAQDFHPGKDGVRKLEVIPAVSAPGKRKRGKGKSASSAKKQRKTDKKSSAQQYSDHPNELSRYIQTCHGADLWEYRCMQLFQYKLCHDGDCSSVPFNYIAPDDLTLGQWVVQQKQLFHEGKMAPEKVSYLQSQGFNFEFSPNHPVGVPTGAAAAAAAGGEDLAETYKGLIEHWNKQSGDDNINTARPGLHPGDSKPAELCNNPKSLQVLWEEYKVGLNGRKPAEQFSPSEKNENKAKYWRRNTVWKCIQMLVDAGLAAEVAIDRIHKVYGYDSSTRIICDGIIADKKKYGGFHPDLCQPEQVTKQLTVVGSAKLSKNPGSLAALWEEYKVGLDGRKPAQQFNKRERNNPISMRQRYYKRNVVWQCIQWLVDAGLAADVAIDRIYQVYGSDAKPTKISELMVADRKKYGRFHPDIVGDIACQENKP